MVRAPLHDDDLQTHLDSIAGDGILRFTLLDGTIRGAVVSGTSMVNAMRANHGLGIIETLALGQAYLCAALASTTAKEGMRIAIRMDGSGVLGGYSVEASWDGAVRGYLFKPGVRLDSPLESFDLGPFFGTGILSVVRTRRAGEEPFTGQVEARTGRVAEDLTHYFLASEQIPTAIAASVRFDRKGRAVGAGGLYLQALPGAVDLDLEDAEARIAELPSLGDWFAQGRDARELIEKWFAAFGPEGYFDAPVAFDCPCSRDRFAAVLSGLRDGGELDDMIKEGPFPAELVCHNCSSVYRFTKEELQALRASLGS